MNRKDNITPSPMPVITLSPRRGRPRNPAPAKDSGTPELLAKKQRGETAEAIDWCLERQLISAEQHWCAIHLRWLHTLRYGVPTVRAVDPASLKGMDNRASDPQWYAQREQEYHEAIWKLRQSGLAALVTGICIYNEYPPALKQAGALRSQGARHFLVRLRDGLDILAMHWKQINNAL